MLPGTALVLGLVASSLTLWPTSVSAAPLPVADGTCVEILGTQWYLRDFDDPGKYSTQWDVDTVNGLVTFISTVQTANIAQFEPRIEFAGYLEACPPTDDNIPTGEPPKGIEEVCVVTTPGAVTDFRLRLRKWVGDGDSGSFVDPDYDDREVSGSVVNFDDVNVIPSRIEVEDFVKDSSFTGSTFEVRIVLGADLLDDVNSPCVFPTDDDDGPSGGRGPNFDIDIDLDHYRNRAVAVAQALPDTL
jgi:hypothetical protein